MSTPGSSDRVVIEPEELRRVATKMHGGAEILSSAGRHIATRPIPDLPGGLESHVAKVVQQANSELQELSLELVQTAGELTARATQAELGEIDSIAWLMPNLRGLVSFDPRGSAMFPSPGRLLGGSRDLESWAERTLRDMDAPVRGDEDGFDLAAFVGELEDPSHGLGDMPTGVMPELSGEHSGDAHPQTGAARGSLAVAFDATGLGPTGLGLLGCLLAGDADQLADPPVIDP